VSIVTVNGEARPLDGFEDASLLGFLREGLRLKGAKPGCGEGECGACTVLVDGSPVRACVTAAGEVAGSSVTTVEGLARDGLLHPVQEAFAREGGFQCGYCTPGMVVATVALLEREPSPSDAAVVEALDGNVCRCCAYPAILRAVRAAAAGVAERRAAHVPAGRELGRPPRPWSSLPPEQRDFWSVLGDGLVVVARRRESALGWATCTESWLHVAPDGTVTAFSGKVDVGQGSGDSLRALVAEGVGVAAGGVEVVLGDTDLCPYDFGTFGSRTTPDSAPLLAAAAAEARRLVDARSEQRLAVIEAPGTMALPSGPPPRRDAAGIVTGAVVFPSDVERPGMLARSPAGPEPPRTDVGDAGLADYLRAHPVEAEGWEQASEEARGDVEAALEDAAMRLDATYATAYLAHAPLETHAAVAEWEGDRLTVWTGTQRPFGVREQLAEALGLDDEQVRVIAPRAGGGFGGKHTGEAAVEAARLAREAGRAVRVHWTRRDEFLLGYVRPAAVIDVRAGALADGTLCAWDFLDLNAGAAAIAFPYGVEHLRVRFRPTDSPLAQGSYRALAATANTFARESHLDELALLAAADPVEYRLRHLDDLRLAAVVEAAAERSRWGRRGLGIAAGLEKGSRVATCAEVELRDDEPVVTRVVTAVDCGGIVDRQNLVNQIEGATVMGLGAALFERVELAHGAVGNASFSTYRVPRFSDVPAIDVVLVDQPDATPAGAGETPIIAVAPAVANAVRALTGERIRALPLLQACGQTRTPDR
jgi:CO/xanthine dehydrogenase Mo-binding subunit/aerobic-type carbon monoxide dehydrogenase small subunit (CoxS/CutS family)